MLPRWTTYGEKRTGRNGKYWEVGSSIPTWNFPDFFGEFRQLLVVFGRIRPEIIGQNPENFGWEYCFHVPDISRVSLIFNICRNIKNYAMWAKISFQCCTKDFATERKI
jgi:hypothetical protein